MTDSDNSSQPDTNPTIRVASPPFDDPDGLVDATIRTSDHVDFHVHKVILQIASPILAEHLSSQPPSAQPERVVIDVAEDSTIWDHVLRICYPLAAPTALSPAELWPLLVVSEKYALECVREAVRRELLTQRMLEEESLRTYLLASAYRFPEVAEAAARASLRKSFDEQASVPELRSVPSTAHFRWVRFHRECVEAATAIGKDKRVFYPSLGRRPGNDMPPVATSMSIHVNQWGIPVLYHATIKKAAMCPISEEYETLHGHVRRGLADYMKRSVDALSEVPVGDTVRDPILVATLARDVMECPGCAPWANTKHNEVAKFVECYATEVDKAVAKVQLTGEI